MPSIDAVTFDTTGLNLVDDSRDPRSEKRAWTSDRGDAVAIMYTPGGEHLPAAARQTPQGLLDYWARQTQDRGGTHIETLLCHVGVGPAVISMAKYPQQPSGMTYIGSVAIPFQDFGYAVMVHCPETGTTGLREALLFDRWMAAGNTPQFADGRVVMPPDWDPDAEEHDADFPDHPMSRLRDLMGQVVGSMRLDPAVHALPRYPLPLDPPKPGQEPTMTDVRGGMPSREARAPGVPGPAARLEALEARRAAFPMEVLEVTAMYAVLIAGSFYIKVVAFVPMLIFFWLAVIGNKVAEHLQVRRDIDRELR
jgi:hypothetical protein